MAQNSSQNAPSVEPESPLRRIPTIKAESETQTSGHIRVLSPSRKTGNEEAAERHHGSSTIRKRRNLSKNRGQGARQREKTPEPGRLGYVPHEDTTSDEEDNHPSRNSREVEADDTYEQMKKLIEAKATVKDEYDIDIEEIREARMMAENARRRRSVSPFAVLDKEELTTLQRKGSFIDPGNKLLSTNYALTPKDDLPPNGRNSLVLNTSARKNSLVISLPSPTGDAPMFSPSTPPSPRRQMAMVYADEEERPKRMAVEQEIPIQKHEQIKAPKEANEKSEELQIKLDSIPKTVSTAIKKTKTEVEPVPSTRPQQTQLERTPSKKLTQQFKSTAPINKPKETEKDNMPPVKPVRSKSATRMGGKTSESEMSEDQYKRNDESLVKTAKDTRRRAAIPRRFIRDKSPKRSKSIAKVEDIMEVTATGMSKTSKEIIDLLQKARGRSLSIPKEDLRIPPEYRDTSKRRLLQTPNKTPSTPKRNSSVICPKTIQLISKKEILTGLARAKLISGDSELSRRSSGYIDASQSEYTSTSCYSSSPSENEYDFDLSKSTAELTRRLSLLSQEMEAKSDDEDLNVKQVVEPQISKVVQRKKTEEKQSTSKPKVKPIENDNNKRTILVNAKVTKFSVIKFMIGNCWKEWRKFITDHNKDYTKIKNLMIRSFSNIIILVLLFGLGGMTFKYLEGDFENAYKCGARNVKRDFIEALWRGSHYLREEDWKSLARNKLFEFENQLHTAHEAGVTSYSGNKSWNFINSVVYCITVITTIGYGDIAPKTTAGQVATIVYAIIGIPLFLILLADFGKLLTRTIKFFWAFVRRLYFTGSCRKVRRTVPMQEVMKGFNMVYAAVRRPSQMLGLDGHPDFSPANQQSHMNPSANLSVPGVGPDEEIAIRADEPETPAPSVFEIDDEFNLPISVALSILVMYIFCGAAVYACTENWSFFEAFYFVFISMSTIGFGDYVPSHGIFMIASIVYLAFGLALTSMCINVVQEKLSDTFRQASAKIGATIGMKLAEEDGGLVPITPLPIEIPSVHGDAGRAERDGKRKD